MDKLENIESRNWEIGLIWIADLITSENMEHFLTNGFFSDKQYGFIKGRSTVFQLLKIFDDWTSQLDAGKQIDVIYTDFEKAFDKVPVTMQ